MAYKVSFFRGLMFGVLAGAAAAQGLFTADAHAQQSSARVLLQTRNPQLAAQAVDAGAVPASQQLSLTLTLAPPPERVAALDKFLVSVITPGSADYHHWVTPQQFAASFGAAAEQLAAANAWAENAGLQVENVSASATRITVSGSAQRVQAAFATTLHVFQSQEKLYFAPVSQPSVPVSAATLFSSVEGLDNLPGNADLVALARVIEANNTAVVSLGVLPAADEYTTLYRQASAQGISTLVHLGTSADALSYALPGDEASAPAAILRPEWQNAPGLPADGLRAVPDLTVPSATSLAQTLSTIAAGSRLGNIAPVLYRLAPTAGLFTQPDGAAAGTWEAATGLGLVDLDKLAAAFPVGTGASFTSFSATSYSPTHGQSTTFTSSVTSGTGGSQPTGSVQFVTANGTVLGTATLVSGTATLSINTLDGGTYNIKAVYSGDSTYASSQSGSAQIFVAPEASQLSAVINGSPSVGGTYTVTVTDKVSYGVPSGPITLTISGSTQTYTQALVPATGTSATATFSLTPVAPNGITLSINCTGTASYSCFNPYTTSVQISKATPVLSLSYSPSPAVSGQQISLQASVSTVGSAPAPTGNVRFLDNGTMLNAGTLSNGSTSTSGTVPTTSTHAITATYDGDPNYNSVSTNAGTNTSGNNASATTLNITPGSVAAGTPATLSATVSGSGSSLIATGSVQFLAGGTLLCMASLSNGGASCPYTPATMGSLSITANYLGDAQYAASSSAPGTLTVTAAAGLLTASVSPANAQPATSATITATATAAAGVVPTGSIVATIANSAGTVLTSYSMPLPGTGTGNTAIVNIPIVAPAGVGAYTITVACSNANFICSPAVLPFTVSNSPNGGIGTLTATVSPASGLPGAAATVAGTLTAATGTTLTGTVTATITGVSGAVYSVALPGTAVTSGTYSIPITLPSTAGVYTVSVSCASAAYTCAPVTTTATSTTSTLIPTVTTLVATASTTASGATVLTATLTSATKGTAVPTGTFIFYDGTTPVGIATVSSTGSASVSLTVNKTITHSFTAVYSGDVLYAPSTSIAVNGNSNTSSAITLTSSTTSVLSGLNVVLTAQVTGLTALGVGPTGTVSFYATGSISRLLGTVTLTNSGAGVATAVLTSTGLPSGTLTIDAVYAGDANFTTVTSNIVTIGVADFSIAFSPANLSLSRGDSGTSTATVSFLGGLNGTVTLGCTPPNESMITCAFTPSTLAGSGTSQLRITTTAPHTAALVAPKGLRTGLLGGISFAAVCGLLLPGRSRRRRIPALVALLVSLGMMPNLGCGQGNFNPGGTSTPTTFVGGSPLGTAILTLTTAASDGSNTVRHIYYYQVTVN